MTRKQKEKRNERLAKAIRRWLLDRDMWIDTTIFFNGKAFSTADYEHENFYYNDKDNLIVLENEDPRKYFKYVNPDHILSMSFEGPLYDVLNGYCDGCLELEERFRKLLEKHGVYYELGDAWNLTCVEM